MLCITASRLRKGDKRLQALMSLFKKWEDGSYTLIGEEPRMDYTLVDMHPKRPTCLTYDPSIKQYVKLYQRPQENGIPIVAVVIDQVTLIFDDGLLPGSRLCAVLLKPPLSRDRSNWETRAPRRYYLENLIEHVTYYYIWDHLARFDDQLKVGGFLFSGSYTDEELRKLTVEEIKLLGGMALAKK